MWQYTFILFYLPTPFLFSCYYYYYHYYYYYYYY